MKTGVLLGVILLTGISAGHPGTAVREQDTYGGRLPGDLVEMSSFADEPVQRVQSHDLSSAVSGSQFSTPGNREENRMRNVWSSEPDGDPGLHGPGHQGIDSILAMDTSTGDVLWVITGTGFDYGSITEKDGRLYFYAGGCLVCVDLRTGEVIWTFGNGIGARNCSGVHTGGSSSSRYYPEGSVTECFSVMEEQGTVLMFAGSTSKTIATNTGTSLWMTGTDDENDAGPISYSRTDP
ncbi:MAG: hypothetical protein AVO35_11860 [Candidatus Aegiribacteria sp. MLS_C]|nr:MAG: hypothetical protein AVO35_11860 [Candidatus Aegiribacteria sp. MLS_C]